MVAVSTLKNLRWGRGGERGTVMGALGQEQSEGQSAELRPWMRPPQYGYARGNPALPCCHAHVPPTILHSIYDDVGAGRRLR